MLLLFHSQQFKICKHTVYQIDNRFPFLFSFGVFYLPLSEHYQVARLACFFLGPEFFILGGLALKISHKLGLHQKFLLSMGSTGFWKWDFKVG